LVHVEKNSHTLTFVKKGICFIEKNPPPNFRGVFPILTDDTLWHIFNSNNT